MKVSYCQSPNFNAKFVSKTKLLHCDKGLRDVSLVEINPFNENDVTAIKEIANDWGDNTLATNIKNTVVDINTHDSTDYGIKIYALTTQNKNFRRLKKDNVLCLSEIIPFHNHVFLSYIQTNPDHMYSSNRKEFEHVGTAMMKSIETKYKNKPIELHSLAAATPFYEQLGYKQKMPDSLVYILQNTKK